MDSNVDSPCAKLLEARMYSPHITPEIMIQIIPAVFVPTAFH